MVVFAGLFIAQLAGAEALMSVRAGQGFAVLLLVLFIVAFFAILVIFPVRSLLASPSLPEIEGFNGISAAALMSWIMAVYSTVSLIAVLIVNTVPVRQVNKRLSFVALSVLLLFALNMISVLGILNFLEAPKVG